MGLGNLWSRARNMIVCTERMQPQSKGEAKGVYHKLLVVLSAEGHGWLMQASKERATLSSRYYTAQIILHSINTGLVSLGVCLHFINDNQKMCIYRGLLSHPSAYLKNKWPEWARWPWQLDPWKLYHYYCILLFHRARQDKIPHSMMFHEAYVGKVDNTFISEIDSNQCLERVAQLLPP